MISVRICWENVFLIAGMSLSIRRISCDFLISADFFIYWLFDVFVGESSVGTKWFEYG